MADKLDAIAARALRAYVSEHELTGEPESSQQFVVYGRGFARGEAEALKRIYNLRMALQQIEMRSYSEWTVNIAGTALRGDDDG